MPYRVGIDFVHARRDWIAKHHSVPAGIKNGQAIGKAHHLYFIAKPSAETITTRVKESELIVNYPDDLEEGSPEVQTAGKRLAVRGMRQEAEGLLPTRLAQLAAQHDFEYTSVSVRQLKARWGSCDQKKNITLNIFLMQLPWELIDYVLLHELVHTQQLHHGAGFWQRFEEALPNAKQRRKTLRAYNPAL